MQILLCTVPDGSLEATTKPARPKEYGFMQPAIGIIKISSWLEKKGYKSELYDINNLRPTDEELIATFKKLKPTVVGLSCALSHCYPNVIRISRILRKLFPDVWIVVGGHITASSHVLLHKTETDICVVGDGEIAFNKLIDYFKLNSTHQKFDYDELRKIKGLAFLDENNKLKVTGFAEQLLESKLEYPDYEKQRAALREKGDWVYNLFPSIKEDGIFTIIAKNFSGRIKELYTRNKDKTIANVPTSQGCVSKCTFCQRYTRGYRAYETSTLETYLLELKEKYNVGAINVWDENFGSNKKQAREFAKIMKKYELLWFANGTRVRNSTYEDLKFYAEHNLVTCKFGIESGSQTILDVIEKKTTAEDNLTTVMNCAKAGVQLTVIGGILLGMPGETEKTVIESAESMASLRYTAGQNAEFNGTFWAWPVPGTPLYEYAQQIGAIGKTVDEEAEYLLRSTNSKTDFLNHVNTSDYSDKELHYWGRLIITHHRIAFKNIILKSNQSIKNKVVELYEKCIKDDLKAFFMYTNKIFFGEHVARLRISPMNVNTHETKDRTFLSKINSFAALLFKTFLMIGTIVLPKAVVYYFTRINSKILFHRFQSKFKLKKGKQRFNLFVERDRKFNNNFKVTDKRLSSLAEPHKRYSGTRSLRKIVRANREMMSPPQTQEEEGLAILAKGQ
jgi:radical SAM superfamily enzyme YgiQ (UPF0313 family)|tara:strand:- start:350 stop:2380 length:2031 start_codon:yes stop_codon:yes gene_type:complete